jgi:hypothetical protein
VNRKLKKYFSFIYEKQSQLAKFSQKKQAGSIIFHDFVQNCHLRQRAIVPTFHERQGSMSEFFSDKFCFFFGPKKRENLGQVQFF